MYMIKRWHDNNLKNYPEEVNRLLDIARSEKH
jgi:MFS transporter, LPLT family, lysophospholipid transporter